MIKVIYCLHFSNPPPQADKRYADNRQSAAPSLIGYLSSFHLVLYLEKIRTKHNLFMYEDLNLFLLDEMWAKNDIIFPK